MKLAHFSMLIAALMAAGLAQVAPAQEGSCHLNGVNGAVSEPVSGVAETCETLKVPLRYDGVSTAVTQIHYERISTAQESSGVRPVLIVVHGGPGAQHLGLHALPLTEVLRVYDVIFYDQRSVKFGDLPLSAVGDPEVLSTRVMVEDLESLRRAVAGDRPVVIYGHSYGGWVSVLYAKTYPQNVSRLILHSSAVSEEAFSQQAQAQFIARSPQNWQKYLATLSTERAHQVQELDLVIQEKVRQGQFRIPLAQGDLEVSQEQWLMMRNTLSGNSVFSSLMPQLLEEFMAQKGPLFEILVQNIRGWSDGVDSAVNVAVLCLDLIAPPVAEAGLFQCPNTSAAYTRPDFVEAARSISVPTLVLAGMKDPLVAMPHTKALSELIPGSQFHLFENAAHAAMVEEPIQFKRVFESFLLSGVPGQQ